ncbi:DinB family protein [Nocardioides sp.]|uniref:mycothiol transferase n=1 Tax=Nocardioides sp. TaxID=35761 RepID=UPI003528F744
MTLAHDLLTDAFGRVHDDLPTVVSGLTRDQLRWRPDDDANPVGWLVWHLTRVQDDHLAGVGQVEQAWTGLGYADRFGLPYPVEAHGYGHSSEDVAAFDVAGPDLLVDYHDAVHGLTLRVLDGLDDPAYERIVDARWDPPVTAAVRLVSVVNDITQHLGQAAYLRGLLERRG